MTATPWGEVEQIPSRWPLPAPGKDPKLLRERQRERLIAATVAVVAEKGYEETRVADIIKTAQVSRNAFYEQFDNKHDCFVATLKALADLAGPAVLDVSRNMPGPWDRRLATMMDGLAATIVAQPAMARLGWVEAYVAGPEAVRQLEGIDEQVEQIVLEALQESPERAGMPREIVRATTRGVRKLVHTRVRERRELELPGLMPDLFEWLQSYHTPTERLRRPRRIPDGLVTPAPEPVDPRDRIVAAITEITAETSYPSMTIIQVAQRASISLTTFYTRFEGKEDAFVAAIERVRERLVEISRPAYRACDDWPHAVAAGLHALLALLASEPALAHLGGIAAHEGGADALASHDAGVTDFHAFLAEGFRLHPHVPEVASEAIGASVYGLLSDQVRRHGAESVYEVAPVAIFIALAPFTGSATATAVANEPVPASLCKAAYP